jgi:hypothetical protein
MSDRTANEPPPPHLPSLPYPIPIFAPGGITIAWTLWSFVSTNNVLPGGTTPYVYAEVIFGYPRLYLTPRGSPPQTPFPVSNLAQPLDNTYLVGVWTTLAGSEACDGSHFWNTSSPNVASPATIRNMAGGNQPTRMAVGAGGAGTLQSLNLQLYDPSTNLATAHSAVDLVSWSNGLAGVVNWGPSFTVATPWALKQGPWVQTEVMEPGREYIPYSITNPPCGLPSLAAGDLGFSC